jgi:hypothetical protein
VSDSVEVATLPTAICPDVDASWISRYVLSRFGLLP